MPTVGMSVGSENGEWHVTIYVTSVIFCKSCISIYPLYSPKIWNFDHNDWQLTSGDIKMLQMLSLDTYVCHQWEMEALTGLIIHARFSVCDKLFK